MKNESWWCQSTPFVSVIATDMFGTIKESFTVDRVFVDAKGTCISAEFWSYNYDRNSWRSICVRIFTEPLHVRHRRFIDLVIVKMIRDIETFVTWYLCGSRFLPFDMVHMIGNYLYYPCAIMFIQKSGHAFMNLRNTIVRYE